MSSQFPEARPRRLRRTPQLRKLFQETEFSLNDLVLPIFVEEDIDDFVPIKSMPGVMRIPESKLAGEIERYARAVSLLRERRPDLLPAQPVKK